MANSSERSVTVLGLGRMGGAMARRLTEEGWAVTGWTRSGRSVPGVETAADPAAAVKGGGTVVLSLFDGPACAEVLAACGDMSGTLVINTSTVSPAEAATLAEAARADYVHAPVLGSVPAVTAGTLTILAGGPAEAVGRARPPLSALGDVLHVGEAADAAALKLVSNGALASVLLGVRDARRHAAELGQDPARTLDVLERGALGGLVRAKRAVLDGAAAHAEFTIRALAKDVALLAAGSPSAAPVSRRVHQSLATARPDDDIAVVCHPDVRSFGDRLTVADTVAVPGEVLAPLRAYARGHATGDPRHFRAAFLSTAHVEGIRDGAYVSWDLDAYCGLFAGRPAPDEATRRRHISQVDAHGTVGTATMTLWHGPDLFTDVFVLARVDGEWRIANKAYHRA
ncbi:nuclear transport factor 2 family protein [Streptosporangiaceae bacterium NEAU-GS5]|nr:nuclear transport factor 2 family protein [Streptosporangiaceae bacterium NEAU-GS5]